MTTQNGNRRTMMASQNARLTILRLIGEHEGEWGWYQFERAFPPGWFTDEPPTTRAKDVLDRLETDGLVTTTPGEPQRKYRLTVQGMDVLREAAIGSTTA
jgi:DNA-binding PadR family transcriptional regulator